MHLTLQEAQLFRILCGLFGSERVIPQMSVVAACGGELPAQALLDEPALKPWARRTKCLFTVVDHEDNPRVVVEFFSGYANGIVAEEVDRQRYLPNLFRFVGVDYVTFSQEEFEDVLTSDDSSLFVRMMQVKLDNLAAERAAPEIA